METDPEIKIEDIKIEDESLTSYSVFVGTKTGILKGLHPDLEKISAKNFPRSEELRREDEITALTWRNSKKTDMLIGHADKSISLFDSISSTYIFRVPVQFGRGKVVGIANRMENAYIGIESGHVGVLFKGEGGKFTNFDTFNGLQLRQHRKNRPTLSCIKADPVNNTRIATGGCENDLKIWDVNETNKLVFAARNVTHDNLNLRVPIWVSDLTYLPGCNAIAVVSRNKCVRLYDPRARRRPVLNVKYEESPITCAAAVPQKDHCIVMGTSHGRVTMYDLRKKVNNRAPVVFKKIDGAIKDVACADNDPNTVYSVSLDRYFRVHDLSTKSTVRKEYLKSKLTKVLV